MRSFAASGSSIGPLQPALDPLTWLFCTCVWIICAAIISDELRTYIVHTSCNACSFRPRRDPGPWSCKAVSHGFIPIFGKLRILGCKPRIRSTPYTTPVHELTANQAPTNTHQGAAYYACPVHISGIAEPSSTGVWV